MRTYWRKRASGSYIAKLVVSYACSFLGVPDVQGWDRALALFTMMPVCRLVSDIISFNASISAGEAGSQWALACQLLRDSAVAAGLPLCGVSFFRDCASHSKHKNMMSSTEVVRSVS